VLLQQLGYSSVCLHGQMSQVKRINSINRVKAGSANILVATDVASRGLDISNVDLVVNYDLPLNGKSYVHRFTCFVFFPCNSNMSFIELDVLREMEIPVGPLPSLHSMILKPFSNWRIFLA
jgi:hypothetical protein